MEYVPLHVKTSYSLLSSLNKIPNLVARAKQLNYSSLAITDTNNMFGVPEFYNECIKNNIKPISFSTFSLPFHWFGIVYASSPFPDAKRSTKSGTISRILVSPS